MACEYSAGAAYRIDAISDRLAVAVQSAPMLTPPDLADHIIIKSVREYFGLPIAHATFLPLGADVNSAVYRLTAEDGSSYFLKLRRGDFDDVAVAVAAYLHARGVRRVMAPLATTTQQRWTHAHGFAWMVYPFFEGQNGFEVALSQRQWIALGESMRAVHTTILPADLLARVPQEDYTPRWRAIVKSFDGQVAQHTFADPVAARFAAWWTTQHEGIRAIVERAEQLANTLQQRDLERVLCHADLHAGNVLLGAEDELAIVDWDTPILAAKERDLMFVGAGIGDIWNDPREAAWFYTGYGPTTIDPVALAYYRYERIVADLAAYGEQIFGSQGSLEDRELGLAQMSGQFDPNSVVEMAHRAYEELLRLQPDPASDRR